MFKKIRKAAVLNGKIRLAKKNSSVLHPTNHVDANTSIGKGTRIMPHNIICSSIIKDCTTIGSHNILSNTSIGSFCSIGSNVSILESRHPIYEPFVSSSPCFYKTKYPMPLIQSDHLFEEKVFALNGFCVEIGNDVWIGSNVIILANIKIGDGAVIGAGSVVTKNVEPYTVVAGNPARIIRTRYDSEVIRSLLQIQWWNWPLSVINERKKDFTNISLFVKKYGKK